MRLAIIPARGGSKRVPGKNTRSFCGQPMLSYPINCAIASHSIDQVWVSTDDPQIAELARQLGAEVPFLRPPELADDHAILQQVLSHALQHALALGLEVTHTVLIFATAPLVAPADIDRGLELLLASDADEALSVVPFASAPQRALRVSEVGELEYLHPEHRKTRTQDLEPCFHDAAQFAWFRNATFSCESNGFRRRSIPVPIDPSRVVDIDTPDDWTRAERMFRLLHPDEANGRYSP